MIDFPIIQQGNDVIRIKVVSGYRIPKTQEFACFKESKKNWVIIDLASGLFIEEGLTSLAECFKWYDNIDISKINAAKSLHRYDIYKQILNNWQKTNQ
jgi:hypothetical protein